MRKLSYQELVIRREAQRMEAPHPVRVLLENVRSLHNVGSILRTADAARIERVYCCGYTPTPEHRAIHKTALGAQDTVPWEVVPDTEAVITRLTERGWRLAALEITDGPTAVSALTETDFPLCLIVGNEVDGVSQETIDRCDLAIEIPQFGTKQSLNVSVAFGIATYDIVRHFRRHHGGGRLSEV